MKRLITILIFVLMISFSSAFLGYFQQGECVDLKTVLNATTVNISTVQFPNGSVAVSNKEMGKTGLTFNYTFCSTETKGIYRYDYFDDKNNAFVNDFEITYNGIKLDLPTSVIYILFIVGLSSFFFLILFIRSRLPEENHRDEEGKLIRVNQLKNLRPILLGVSWAILISLVFMAYNVAQAYLQTNMFSNFLWMIFQLMMWLTIPMLIILGVYMFQRVLDDIKKQKLIDRGVFE